MVKTIYNIDKTICIVSSKEPTRCELEIDQKIEEQVNHFKYLGAEISGCLRDVVWKNKYLNINSKIRVYKSTIRK